MRSYDFNVAPNTAESAPQNSTITVQDKAMQMKPPIKFVTKSNHEQHQQQQRSLQKQITATEYGITTSRINHLDRISNNITLDKIISEYLANQHSKCKNPISTCPPFDLFTQHKCPDPKPNSIPGMCSNFASRYHYRQGGYSSKRLDRHLVHSQFCMTKLFRSDISYFKCCDFLPCKNCIIVGLHSGEVELYNIECGKRYTYPCHNSYVHNVKCSKNGSLVLTSSLELSKMWIISRNSFLMKLAFDGETYVEFSKVNEDKILGTNAKVNYKRLSCTDRQLFILPVHVLERYNI